MARCLHPESAAEMAGACRGNGDSDRDAGACVVDAVAWWRLGLMEETLERRRQRAAVVDTAGAGRSSRCGGLVAYSREEEESSSEQKRERSVDVRACVLVLVQPACDRACVCRVCTCPAISLVCRLMGLISPSQLARCYLTSLICARVGF